MSRAAVIFTSLLLLPWNAVSQDLPDTKNSISIGTDAQINSGGAGAVSQAADTDAPSPSMTVTVQSDTTPKPAGPLSFDARVERGHSLYMEGRHEEALREYNEARNEKTEDPAALYYVGCTLTKLGRYDEAERIFERMRVSTGATTPSACARALFMLAILFESRNDDAAAVKAWTEYKIFAEAHPMTVSFVPTAAERLRVYDAKAELEAKYQAVRERIARDRD